MSAPRARKTNPDTRPKTTPLTDIYRLKELEEDLLLLLREDMYIRILGA